MRPPSSSSLPGKARRHSRVRFRGRSRGSARPLGSAGRSPRPCGRRVPRPRAANRWSAPRSRHRGAVRPPRHPRRRPRSGRGVRARAGTRGIRSGGPSATLRPRSRTITRSASLQTSLGRCVQKSRVFPAAFSRASSSPNSRRIFASRLLVGSSRSRTGGSDSNATTSASFCLMPPDSWLTDRLWKSWSPQSRSNSSTRSGPTRRSLA